MSALRSCVLRGQLEGPITFPFGLIENIREGTWQIAFSSVSFAYTSNIRSTFLAVSSNYVTGFTVNASKELVSSEVIMNIIHIKGSAGSKGIVGFRQRDFYQVTDPTEDLTIHFVDVQTGRPVTGSEVIVHALLKRVR